MKADKIYKMVFNIKQIKVLIRSLVQSSPEELTLEILNRDFKEEEGTLIPHNEFGHKSLESFLRSMPDTVVVYGSGIQATVRAIGTQKSGHIKELVAHQKKGNKDKARNKTLRVNHKYQPIAQHKRAYQQWPKKNRASAQEPMPKIKKMQQMKRHETEINYGSQQWTKKNSASAQEPLPKMQQMKRNELQIKNAPRQWPNKNCAPPAQEPLPKIEKKTQMKPYNQRQIYYAKNALRRLKLEFIELVKNLQKYLHQKHSLTQLTTTPITTSKPQIFSGTLNTPIPNPPQALNYATPQFPTTTSNNPTLTTPIPQPPNTFNYPTLCPTIPTPVPPPTINYPIINSSATFHNPIKKSSIPFNKPSSSPTTTFNSIYAKPMSSTMSNYSPSPEQHVSSAFDIARLKLLKTSFREISELDMAAKNTKEQ